MLSKLSIYSRNLDCYRQLERARRRWKKLRRLFKLGIEDTAFFIGQDKCHTPASLERQAKMYFAMLLNYARLERTNDFLRAERLRERLSLGEAAFLLAEIDDADQVPNQLRAARLRTGLSQEEVAYIIGKLRSVLSSYEQGKCKPDLAPTPAAYRRDNPRLPGRCPVNLSGLRVLAETSGPPACG